ncbi:MAG: (d)CMP kinase, partial [Chloroflexota bacterium]|nr:(d)CMP kinase [Chloroflexota bacterium]
MAELTESQSGDAKGSFEATLSIRELGRRLRPAVITIDGPAASGKSTVGYALAQALDYLFLDTGVMYRAVTWAALRRSLDVEDGETVGALAA